MLIVYGTYRLAQRVVGFRNDYCLNCQAQRIAVQIRSFRLGHLLWLPVLPLGFWKVWRCTSCGVDPHARTRTSSGLVRWAAVVLLAIFAMAMWDGGVDPSEAGMTWTLRILVPLAVPFAIWWAVRRPVEPVLKQELATVVPYSGATCPACGNALLRGSTIRCGACDAEQLDLERAG